MKASRGVVLAFAMLMAMGSFAQEPELPSLKTWTLPAYTVIAHDERIARRVVVYVSQTDEVLSKLLKYRPHPTGIPTYIYVLGEATWNDLIPFEEDFYGAYLPTPFANYLFVDTHIFDDLLRDGVLRLYSEHYLRSQYHGAPPRWFVVGVTALMRRAEIHGSHTLLGASRYWSSQDKALPINRVLAIDEDSPEYQSPSLLSAFRYQSWSLVHQAFIGDAQMSGQVHNYLAAVDDFLPIDEAVPASFGMTMDQLDAKTRAYRRENVLNTLKIPMDRKAVPPLPPARALSDSQAFESLADAMLATSFNATRVEELVDSARVLAPQSAVVRILEMRLAVRDGDDEKLGRMLAELAPVTGDPVVARRAGLALLERVADDKPGEKLGADDLLHLREVAYKLLEHSLAQEPLNAEAAWGYGLLAVRLNRDLDRALSLLQKASARTPMHPDLSKVTALVYEAQGNHEKMLASLKDTARYSSSLQQREWAKARIDAANVAGKAQQK